MIYRSLISTAMLLTSVAFSYASEDNQNNYSRYDWNGWYIGGQLATSDAETTLTAIGNPRVSGLPADYSPNGIIRGVTGGVNWQSGDWVFGLEASWMGAGKIEGTQAPWAPPYFVTTKISDIYTVGPRVGYTNGRLLIYAEGGYASAELDIDAVNIGPGLNPQAKRSEGHFLGAGLDWAINENLIWGLEYNHIELDDKMLSDSISVNTFNTNFGDVEVDTFSVKLTVKTN